MHVRCHVPVADRKILPDPKVMGKTGAGTASRRPPMSPGVDMATPPCRPDAPRRRDWLKIAVSPTRIAKDGVSAGGRYTPTVTAVPVARTVATVGQDPHELRPARPDRSRARHRACRLWRRAQAVELGHPDRGDPRAARRHWLPLRGGATGRLRVVVDQIRPRETGAAGEGGGRVGARSQRRLAAETDRRHETAGATGRGADAVAAGLRPNRHLARTLL